ncbi:non-ribosomal peptide synthetase [Pseudonocardia adelaidensis]|uniref:Amino acid adenylation domain-containing protein n=1 Tax=Pseudonocardia adelaidensis TaxID=648754 RepID=A0ABP9N6J7_9PSEU
MNTQIETGRDFWQRVLAGGGATAIPRWTLDPVPGTAEHVAPLRAELVAAMRRLAGSTNLPLHSLVLAAHAKVLSALSGEPDVVTGYAAGPAGRALPCPLTAEPGSWRSLLQAVAPVEMDVVRHRAFDLDALTDEIGVAGPRFETEFDPIDTLEPRDLAGGVVLRIGLTNGGGALRLTYRTDALDDPSARRIAGYHLAALEAMVADPDAEHGRAVLLSPEELRFQLDGLAGPRRELPDRRFHELFEQRVRMHPDAVAAVHRDRRWTYRELDARANRLGRALLARGLRREGVVAVVTERNLDWVAAVIAIFKAGGAYLPIEPHFPADRIARTLSRADCTLVLTEPGSTTTLDPALESLPGVQKVFVGTAYAEGHADTGLGVAVAADQLAYIYFTSGSTGEPKGAMCEHAGMLNHLHAKISDLGIREGEVVAQVAPQCFDISLWQLVSALLVGGRTVLVEQDVILDVARFVETLERERVGVAQVVPSYLEVVLSYLEQHPHELPDLHCVSATGEALKTELAQRFFAVRQGTALVNAYGLTETSDDTNHEVMHAAPEGGRMPLGPAVQNVDVYVVDEHLQPVPLGAPGLIAFSGVCVGRGYVNDPERTRATYLTDPHRPGRRLYKGGDYGRWRPDGKLEFLGRRDNQVKISGFRIEIGEIDDTLLRVPGVRDGAVVVTGRGSAERADGTERPDRGKHLVAFYSGDRPLDVDLLRERLGASLPHYMVPVAFHWRENLPLTGNGKIDTKALTALAAELAATTDDDEHEPPATPTEVRLAAVWARMLGLDADRIGRRDRFFDLGGSSLSAVKLAVALDRVVSLKDVVRHPALADLAELIDSRPAPDELSGEGRNFVVACRYA